MPNRSNKACGFFPCHPGLEDCTFCYCPFYPCLNEIRGKFIYSTKHKKDIWSCMTCNWIHKISVVDNILASIRNNNRKGRQLKTNNIGVIILSHGSRLQKANASLNKIVRAIRQKTGLDTIVPAYLQFCHPDLERSVKDLVAKGIGTVVIIPFFLFNGNHVTRDIPHIIKIEKEKYPQVNFVYTKNLGEDTRIPDIVSDMVEEAAKNVSAY